MTNAYSLGIERSECDCSVDQSTLIGWRGIFFGCGRETTDGDSPRRIDSLSGSYVCLGYILNQPGWSILFVREGN